MKQSVLVTGANRGIGLEFVRQYAADGWRVFAGCRSPETAIDLNRVAEQAAGRMSTHPLDVTNAVQIKAMAAAIGDSAIDVLINNAGVAGQRDTRIGNIDQSSWLDTFKVNSIAPLSVIEAFEQAVAKSRRKIIATLSSRLGSIAENTTGGNYIYRSSKAAVNAVMKSAALDLRPRGISVVLLHPGWVRTDMGGPQAPLTTEESVAGMRRVLQQVTIADTGKFLDYQGQEIPW